MLERRFYPEELKHRKIEEFMECKQGNLSVQDFTDLFNSLAHFAEELLPDEARRVFYYRRKLKAEVTHLMPKDLDTVEKIYNVALLNERSLARIKEEAAPVNVPSQKRPFSSPTYSAPKRNKSPGGSGPKKPHFTSRPAWKKTDEKKDFVKKDAVCYSCGDPYHPGLTCGGDPITAAAATTAKTGGAARRKGRIFVLSRADAEANPDVITGTYLVSGRHAFILFDTGASISVISSKFAEKASLVSIPAEPVPISLPSGEAISCVKAYVDVPILIAGEVFPTTLLDFPAGEFDVILGIDWLALYDARFSLRSEDFLEESLR
ncbi:uncharacterized protein LOC141630818 [Silene latifolia]|uniref:uncharacterized protein LOC141630818 n=1 Tax=Silene latifolia TaxID=37657 RepID=UPI003D782EC2